MSDSVDRVFVHALNTVKRIPRTGSARPPPAARLRLYGLYKQSMEGDVQGVMRRPEGNNPNEEAERDKWYHEIMRDLSEPVYADDLLPSAQILWVDAWSSNHSLSRTEAKRRYISTLIETMHKYASTTSEARELVAELEFVWDQIKSNPASDSASSPGPQIGGSAASGHQLRSSYGGTGPGQSRPRETDTGVLRVLRPVSDADEEEIEGDEFEEARSGLTDDEGNDERIERAKEPSSRDLDVRNRKWRRRVEQALMKMTAEVAALREQLESKSLFEGRQKPRIWAWIVWMTWATVKHILIDTAALIFLYLWFKRKDDQRFEMGVRLLARATATKIQRARLVRRLQPSKSE